MVCASPSFRSGKHISAKCDHGCDAGYRSPDSAALHPGYTEPRVDTPRDVFRPPSRERIQIPLPQQEEEDFLGGLDRAEVGSVEPDLGVLGGLVGIADAGELGDEALARLLIEPLRSRASQTSSGVATWISKS